jgi:hypothetical protein
MIGVTRLGMTECAGGWHGVPGGARGGAGHDAALWGAGGALRYFAGSSDSTYSTWDCERQADNLVVASLLLDDIP